MNIPTIEIVGSRGMEDVAEVFTARTRPGDDKSLVEFVDGLDTRYPRDRKWIANISTQYGCPIGCAFCDAGREYHGNLTAGEMLAQVGYVMDRHPGLPSTCAKFKVHFARMGEPSLNDAVIEALELLPEFTSAPGLLACVATSAPAGRDLWFDRLIDIKERLFRGRFQLQFSINSTDEIQRASLMPARLFDLGWIAGAAKRFYRPGDRKVVLNFALAEGVSFDPKTVVSIFDPSCTMIKLTPLNPTATGKQNGLGTIMRSPLDKIVDLYADALGRSGFDVVLSAGDGREDEIGSNCGQSVMALREIMTSESK